MWSNLKLYEINSTLNANFKNQKAKLQLTVYAGLALQIVSDTEPLWYPEIGNKRFTLMKGSS